MHVIFRNTSLSGNFPSFEENMAACVNGNSERLIVKGVYKFKASNNDEVRQFDLLLLLLAIFTFNYSFKLKIKE